MWCAFRVKSSAKNFARTLNGTTNSINTAIIYLCIHIELVDIIHMTRMTNRSSSRRQPLPQPPKTPWMPNTRKMGHTSATKFKEYVDKTLYNTCAVRVYTCIGWKEQAAQYLIIISLLYIWNGMNHVESQKVLAKNQWQCLCGQIPGPYFLNVIRSM